MNEFAGDLCNVTVEILEPTKRWTMFLYNYTEVVILKREDHKIYQEPCLHHAE